MTKIKLKKGDMVVVRSGKFRGRTGKVLAVHPKINKVTVEGINKAKKHLKPTQANPRGGIIDIHRPMGVSKLGIYDSVKKRPSRIGTKIDKSGKHTRVMKTSGKEIKS